MFNPYKKKPFEIDDFAKLVITEAKKAGITAAAREEHGGATHSALRDGK